MIFSIARTTSGSRLNKPHPKAFLNRYTLIDRRSTDDPAKVPAHKGESEWWYASGTNHRVVDGNICRDYPDHEGWFIEINTLEELIELKKECKTDLIIGQFHKNFEIMEIEIYDSWRE